MTQNFFTTETDSNYVRQQTIRASINLFIILTFLAYFIGYNVTWQLFLYLEGIILLSCFYTYKIKKHENHSWKLQFENDYLYITNQVTNEIFEVYDIPSSDFIIKQTKKEISLDYCSLLIKDTVFTFGGVKHCSQLKQYISQNYK